MPEWRECFSHWVITVWLWLHYRKLSYNSRKSRVKALWADPITLPEAKKPMFKKIKSVFRLQPHHKFRRGARGRQTHLWPQVWAKGKPGARPITDLNLQNIDYTGRAMILDFGALRLKLSYLTHTSVQLYPIDVWNESIRPVPKVNRGASVALAIEFEECVLAFMSLDNVVQPEWFTRDEEIPREPDVFNNFPGFLQGVADWIAAGRESCRERNGLAWKVVRDTKIWCGVGVYTASDIFFMAGLSTFLSEAEVFDNPSRTARLCLAFHAFAARAVVNDELFQKLLRRCIRNGLLAPTKEQRERYCDWLHVYGKRQARYPKRMGELVDDYYANIELLQNEDAWFRDTVNLYDPFDPYFLNLEKTNAFERALAFYPSLGPLIFGNAEWESIDGRPAVAEGLADEDPLTKMFRAEGLLGSRTFLHPKHYPQLYETTMTRRNVKLFKLGSGESTKKVWTILPPFPSNSYSSAANAENGVDRVFTVIPIHGKKWQDEILAHRIRNTNLVGIGPLEYCGNAHIIGTSHGRHIVMAVRGDPNVAKYYSTRYLKRWHRTSIIKSGIRRRAMTQGQLNSQSKYLHTFNTLAEVSPVKVTRTAQPEKASPSHVSVPSSPPLSSLSIPRSLSPGPTPSSHISVPSSPLLSLSSPPSPAPTDISFSDTMSVDTDNQAQPSTPPPRRSKRRYSTRQAVEQGTSPEQPSPKRRTRRRVLVLTDSE